MSDLQQQKIAIDLEAQRVKDEADKKAAEDRQAAADEEIRKIREEAEYKIQEILKNVQR